MASGTKPTNEPTDQTASILNLVLQDLPEHYKPASKGIDTGAFLSELARSWPAPLDVDKKLGLVAICRILSVTKQLRPAYDTQWKRALNRETLEPPYWPILIAVLSVQFQDSIQFNETDKGIALKQLNAAFAAMDIVADLPGIRHLPQLKSHLESQLDALLRQ